jgi:hypothetical protein
VLLFTWRPAMHWIKRALIAVVAWLAISGAGYVADTALTDQKMYAWHNGAAQFDIAGTLKYMDGTIPDAELSRILAGTGLRIDKDIHATIRARYRMRNFYFLVAGPDNVWDVYLHGYVPAPQAQRDAVERAWREIVGNHFGAYLAHRLRIFRECLAFPAKTEAYWPVASREFPYPVTAEREGIGLGASAWQEGWTSAFTWLWHATPLFEPWMYLALALLLLPFARKHRDVLALLLSGIGIELTLFFLASSPDYRYSHWLVTCVTISVIVIVARRMIHLRPT